VTAAELREDVELARYAARQAGAAVLRHFGTPLEVRHKTPSQPITAADLEADTLLKELLAGTRPSYGWLSEETEDSPDRLQRSRVWIVDPIDGTRSFIAGRPDFTVSVGLAVDGDVVLGVVYNPARDELFCAVRGAGARLETPAGRATLRLGAHAAVTLLASRTEIAAGEIQPIASGWAVEGVGSTAYKLALVARNRGAFVSRGQKMEWDVCAGALLVAEAGGRVTDGRGAELAFNRPDPNVRGIAAADASLHEELLLRVAALEG
jgi:myo-inositol-1(or 4)-monophosphatase